MASEEDISAIKYGIIPLNRQLIDDCPAFNDSFLARLYGLLETPEEKERKRNWPKIYSGKDVMYGSQS